MAAEIERLVSGTEPPPPPPPPPGGVLTKAVLIGSPGRKQFPGNDERSCFARAIKDLLACKINGIWRCFVGYGDILTNVGPMIVWSFLREGTGFSFGQEVTLHEESVDLFVEHGERVYVPGSDPRGDRICAIYIRDRNGVWADRQTIGDKPSGTAQHVYSLAVRGGDVYVIPSYWNAATRTNSLKVLKSTDDGRDWDEIGLDRGVVPIRLVRAGDNILIFGAKDGIDAIHLLDAQDRFDTVLVHPFPTLPTKYNGARREVSFGEGALYISKGGSDTRARKLFYFDVANGAALVAEFGDPKEYIRDIAVQGDRAYVLTVPPATWQYQPPFTARVYASPGGYRLDSWTKIADVPGLRSIPSCLEVMEGNVFVGLGNGRRTIANRRQGDAFPRSGDIYVLG